MEDNGIKQRIINKKGTGREEEEMEGTGMTIEHKGALIGIERGVRMGVDKGVRIGVEKGVRIGVKKGVVRGVEKGVTIGVEKRGLKG